MSTRRPDKALRRMVAELAGAAQEDIEAVLDELDGSARQKIEALLAEYRGEVIQLSEVAQKPVVSPVAIEGLSPWLMARLDRRSQTTATRPGSLGEASGEARDLGVAYTMTLHAFEALRTAAETVQREAAREDADHQPSGWKGPARKALLGKRGAR